MYEVLQWEPMLTHAFVPLFVHFYPVYFAAIPPTQSMSNFVQYLSSSHFFLQRAGLGGAAGQYAARSAVVESRCAAEAASLRMACAREQLKKGEPATLSLALVSPSPVI